MGPGAFYAAEAYGYSDEFLDYMKDIPIKAERGSASDEVKSPLYRHAAELTLLSVVDAKAPTLCCQRER
jgi:hypothetical protein